MHSFSPVSPLLEEALSCHWPADDCIVYYRTGGVMGENSIVHDFYALTARWAARKNPQLSDLIVLVKPLAKPPSVVTSSSNVREVHCSNITEVRLP